MPYKRLRQGEIKNAYFWVIFGWRLEKKTWQISLLKMCFFTEQNLVLSLLCLQIKQHTDGQLYILHPDECRCLWACPVLSKVMPLGHPGMVLPCRWCQPAHWYPSVPEVHRLGYCRVRSQGRHFLGQPAQVPSEVVNGIEKVFTVMAPCAGKFHQKREFNFQPAVPAAEHIQGMPEKPCFIVAAPSPCGIRVRIMAGASVPVWAGFTAGGKMPAVRGSMGNNGRAVTG